MRAMMNQSNFDEKLDQNKELAMLRAGVSLAKSGASKVKIDSSLVDKNEIDVLEDLILAALNDATNKVSENMNSELGSITGGLNLPPGMKLPF